MAGSPTVSPPARMEVDPNLLAADCVVICTCCPCLVLQLLVLLLLRLPYKLAKRSKRLVLRRLRRKRPRAARPGRRELPAELVVVAEAHAHPGARVQMGAPEAVLSAIAEAERVLAQLYEEGELGFGSFWRRGPGGGQPLADHHLVGRGGGGSNVHCVQVLYV